MCVFTLYMLYIWPRVRTRKKFDFMARARTRKKFGMDLEGIRYDFIAFWECKLSSKSGEYNSKQNKMKSPMAKLLAHGALVVALVEELGPSSSSWGPLSWPWSRNLGQGPRPGSPHCGLGRGTWALFETSTTHYKTTKVRQETTRKYE